MHRRFWKSTCFDSPSVRCVTLASGTDLRIDDFDRRRDFSPPVYWHNQENRVSACLAMITAADPSRLATIAGGNDLELSARSRQAQSVTICEDRDGVTVMSDLAIRRYVKAHTRLVPAQTIQTVKN